MYKILGKYKSGSFEQIDSCYTLKDAKFLVEEYKMAYDKDWEIIFYRVS